MPAKRLSAGASRAPRPAPASRAPRARAPRARAPPALRLRPARVTVSILMSWAFWKRELIKIGFECCGMPR
jgi:hypothetical protein